MNETDLDETHGAKLAKIELKKKVYRSAAVGKGRLGHLKHRGGGGGGGGGFWPYLEEKGHGWFLQ